MSRTTIVYLKWLTEENYNRRSSIVNESLESLCNLRSQNCDITIINNGGIKSSFHQQDFFTIDLSKNYYDISVHFSAYFLAKWKNKDFFIYTYDDFVFFDDDFLNQCQKFLDLSPEIFCIRLPEYEYGNSYFNANITPKSINPDAVRHEQGAANADLYFDGPQIIQNKEFYKTNWYPNSRPTMWRTSSFEKMIKDLDLRSVPVMQSFERFMYNQSDFLAFYGNFVSSFINGGVCRTFSTDTSERELAEKKQHNRINWNRIFVDVTELKNELFTKMENCNE